MDNGFSVQQSVAEGVAGLQRLINNCAACECPNLLLGGTGDKALFERYFETVRECCDYAADRGVGLTIKPHGGENATGKSKNSSYVRVIYAAS